MTLKCIEMTEMRIELPVALFLVYPCLSFDMACWMKDDQLSLLQKEERNFARTKTEIDLRAPLENDEAPRAINILTDQVDMSKSWISQKFSKPIPVKTTTTLCQTSRMSFFGDRIIRPESN